MAGRFRDSIEVKGWPADCSAGAEVVRVFDVTWPDLAVVREAVRFSEQLAFDDLEGRYRNVQVLTSNSLILAQFTPAWMIAPRHA